MAYSEAEQIIRTVVNDSFTADGTSTNTTFTRRGNISVSGSFTATVQLQQKTLGDDVLPGEWIDAGELTEPGTAAFSSYKPRPFRFIVKDFIDGTVNVFLEINDELY